VDGSLILLQRKGTRKRNKPPVNKHSEKSPTSKATQLVDYRADLSLGQHANLNCHTSLREELTKQLPLKDRSKKTKNKKQTTIQPAGETMTELGLKYQHQDWMLEE
jgi:hypothetical protein